MSDEKQLYDDRESQYERKQLTPSNLDRLPTLSEILLNKTQTPLDLSTFYKFMVLNSNPYYLDFYFDYLNHLNLCKHYIKGLRDSIRNSAHVDDISRNKLGNTIPGQVPSNRDSNNSKHKSLSSSILLDLIINDNILQDNSSFRLSQFLRGDIRIDNLDPKLANVLDTYRNSKNLEETRKSGYSAFSADRKSNLRYEANDGDNFGEDLDYNSNRNSDLSYYKIDMSKTILPESKRNSFDQSPDLLKGKKSESPLLSNKSSNQKLYKSETPLQSQRNSDLSYYRDLNFDKSLNQTGDFDKLVLLDLSPPPKHGSINPQLLESLIRDASDHNSFITRDNLKDSSHQLLLKYFVEDSEKNLNLPYEMNNSIIHAIEIEGRDDPDIFKNVKSYIFNKIEHEDLPQFLNFMAIRNINHSNFIRILVGFFFLFAAFWIGYVLIFLDYSKGLRAVTVVPFFIAFYCLISSIYLIDPILCWLGYSESFAKSNSSIIKIREKFVYKLLFKRSLWVLLLILLFTAALTLVFSLVPGHRL